jgi:hypothetical protein
LATAKSRSGTGQEVTQRYMVAEIVRLIEAAERVLETGRRTTVPLTIIRRKAA